jgi:Flp pilus assembly protein TadD
MKKMDRSRAGLLLLRSGHAKQALKVLALAMKSEPKNPNHAYAYGLAQLQAGAPEEAVQAFGKALSLDQTHAPTHCGLGEALLAMEAVDEARASFEHCIALAGKKPAGLRAKALLRRITSETNTKP